MSIRLIALELYRLHREVTALEKALEDGSAEQIARRQEELLKTRAEYNRLRRVLDGHKD